MKRTYTLLFSLILVLSGCCKEESMSSLSDRVFNLAKKQLTLLAEGTPSDCMPVTYENGEMDYAGLPAWTSGFLPGSLW
ncbi:MAG: glucuronyl hydrolase, partial [Bacteroidales bacterium]|nr:glucuronyl hydrolase [Candidatus Cacconaster equifaecalis]